MLKTIFVTLLVLAGSIAYAPGYGYLLQGHSLPSFVNRQHLCDPVAECVFARPSHKRQLVFAHGGKLSVYHHLFKPGYSHFHPNKFSAGGYAHFPNGYDAAYAFAQWIYVSH